MKVPSHDQVSWAMLLIAGVGYVVLLVTSSNTVAATLLTTVITVLVILLRNERSTERRRRRRQQAGLCPLCSYDLKHDFGNGCSECGWERG